MDSGAASPYDFPQRRPDWGYYLVWGILLLLTGLATYFGVVSNPAIAPPDREPIEPLDGGGQSVTAKAVRIQALDPGSSTVRWELRVPETAGGITSATTFDQPEIILFPEAQGFRITAQQGSLREAPAGEAHDSANARLDLSGPIQGRSADGREEFSAESATWDGRLQQLTLTGSPLRLLRQGLQVTASRLIVTFAADGTAAYDLSGGVRVEGSG